MPVINAGDGNGGQHPTQALLDLYTIYRERPLDGLSIAFIGELDRGRTVRSLAYLLAKFERVKIYFVSPPEMQMKPDILQYLERHDVRYEAGKSERPGARRSRCRVPDADSAGASRRRTGPLRLRDRFVCVATDARDAMILHPLPRTVELDKTVDDDPRALYFRQAANGLYVRMALLTMLLDGSNNCVFRHLAHERFGRGIAWNPHCAECR